MNNTHLLYMETMWLTEGEATVEAVIPLEDKTIVILDQTLFYAQGGGQAFDQGTIESANGVFAVKEVRFVEGTVKHGGDFISGSFTAGEKVRLKVDPVRRVLNSRLHSAGHIVDMGLKRLGIQWKAVKGYHFSEGPYCEYEGQVPEGEAEVFRAQLEAKCQEVVAGNAGTHLEFISAEEMQKRGYTVPAVAPEKPLRLVHYGEEFALPCGGTHVQFLGDVGDLKIRKIKQDKDHVRVAYDISPHVL